MTKVSLRLFSIADSIGLSNHRYNDIPLLKQLLQVDLRPCLRVAMVRKSSKVTRFQNLYYKLLKLVSSSRKYSSKLAMGCRL